MYAVCDSGSSLTSPGATQNKGTDTYTTVEDMSGPTQPQQDQCQEEVPLCQEERPTEINTSPLTAECELSEPVDAPPFNQGLAFANQSFANPDFANPAFAAAEGFANCRAGLQKAVSSEDEDLCSRHKRQSLESNTSSDVTPAKKCLPPAKSHLRYELRARASAPERPERTCLSNSERTCLSSIYSSPSLREETVPSHAVRPITAKGGMRLLNGRYSNDPIALMRVTKLDPSNSAALVAIRKHTTPS